MKFSHYVCNFFILLCLMFLISGCTEVKTEGFILKIEEGRILVAENITFEIYEEIKDKTIQELDEARVSLIYLSYNNINSLKAI